MNTAASATRTVRLTTADIGRAATLALAAARSRVARSALDVSGGASTGAAGKPLVHHPRHQADARGRGEGGAMTAVASVMLRAVAGLLQKQ